jgi:phage terminase large subunit GpA-like protein
MDSINHPQVETTVLMSSSQVGKTETIINIIGYHMHQDPCPMLCIEPTLDMAEGYSKDRIAPMIRDTPVLSDLIREPRSKDGSNTLLHKKFPGGHVTLGGANSPAGLASRPVRIVLCDEVDRYPVSAGAEGDPVSLASKRATTFWNRKKIYVSSPTIKGLSRIEAWFEASDKRFFQVPCHACGEFQKLEWEFVRWEYGRPETAVYVCALCGAAWTDAERHDAVMLGRWIAEAPFNGIAGFHIWEAYSPWSKLSDIVENFLNAKHAADMGDNELLKAFVNTSLGRSWEEKAETVAAAPLLSRCENYAADSIPWPILYLTAGVDVQDDRIELEVVGWRAEKRSDPEESWGVEHKIFYGDPAKPEIWNDVDEFTRRFYTTEDGRQLRISAVCIDSGGHHTQAVYKFCNQRIARHVYAIKGAAGARPIWPKRAGKSKKHAGSLIWLIGVDTAKDTLYARLRISEPGPGYCHFSVDYDEAFFKQLTAEQVRTRYIKGHPVREWHKPPGVRNEALDVRVYAIAALHSRSVPWEILARSVTPPAVSSQQSAVSSPEIRNPKSETNPKSKIQNPKSDNLGGRKVRFKFGR